MKVICEMILHYGKQYLDKALCSVDPFVDDIIILYRPTASQGHPTDLPCPDTRDELMAIAKRHPKAHWIDLEEVGNEFEHRLKMTPYTKGYDVKLICDADEVFDPIDLPRALKEVYESDKSHFNVSGFMHFWKGHKYYLDDDFQPTRFVNLNNKDFSYGVIKCKIYHFSYSQPIEIIKYKLQVSGHFDEFRKDWLPMYEAWEFGNGTKKLHPTTLGVWEDVKEYTGTLPYGL